jgi:hypothetical protein
MLVPGGGEGLDLPEAGDGGIVIPITPPDDFRLQIKDFRISGVFPEELIDPAQGLVVSMKSHGGPDLADLMASSSSGRHRALPPV